MSTAEDYIADEKGRRRKIKGCYPAMGYSFAAGTTDGPGAFSFKQGTLTDNPLWNVVRDFISQPKSEDIKCHAPKPILLATGRMKFPYDWQPRIVSTQVALIGNILLACVPGEFTTMAGRRLKNSLAKLLEINRLERNKVIIAGLCNTYSDYVTTFEEYQAQRYEGASTIYGPHTLDLHILQYQRLTEAVLKNTPMDGGPQPQGPNNNMLSLITPVVFDTAEIGHKFGDVVVQPIEEAHPGDIVRVKFISGHPRNNLKHGNTYCTVEKQESADVWNVVATDANWETKVRWTRKSKILGTSEIEVEWSVPDTVLPGIYRIRHFGNYKFIFGGIFPYEGTSESFRGLTNMSSAITLRLGLKAVDGQFPYLVRVYIVKRDKVGTCTGSVVAHDTILTAAHCCNLPENTFIAAVSKAHIHPKFDHTDSKTVHDVCVLKLQEKMIPEDGHKIIRVSYEDVDGVLDCIAAGWGTTTGNFFQNELYYAHVQAMRKEMFGVQMLGLLQHATCKGDSGSPLIYDGKVIGVSSFGSFKGTERMVSCDFESEDYYMFLREEADFLTQAFANAGSRVMISTCIIFLVSCLEL